jgi:hypothetical protein
MSTNMSDDALRSLVRDTIARLQGGTTAAGDDVSRLHVGPHASHARYSLPPSDGPCVIEPGVRCNHCGYCESHGH